MLYCLVLLEILRFISLVLFLSLFCYGGSWVGFTIGMCMSSITMVSSVRMFFRKQEDLR